MDAFAIAEQAEHAVGDIYRILASYFAFDPDLRALFVLLEQEERAHARRVRGLAERRAARGATWQPALDVKRMQRLLRRARAFHHELARADVIEAEAALRLSMDLEDAFGAAHAEALAHERDPELRELFAVLSEHDYGHRELLARHSRPAASTADSSAPVASESTAEAS